MLSKIFKNFKTKGMVGKSSRFLIAKNVSKFQIVFFWNWWKMQQIYGKNSRFTTCIYQRFCRKNFWLCNGKRGWRGRFDASVREPSQELTWADYYEFTRDFERKWNFFAIPIFSHEQKCDWKNFWRKKQTFVRANQFSARFHL